MEALDRAIERLRASTATVSDRSTVPPVNFASTGGSTVEHTIELSTGKKVSVVESPKGVRLAVDGDYSARTEQSLYAGSDGGPARLIALEAK
jgi:hypothetical protein